MSRRQEGVTSGVVRMQRGEGSLSCFVRSGRTFEHLFLRKTCTTRVRVLSGGVDTLLALFAYYVCSVHHTLFTINHRSKRFGDINIYCAATATVLAIFNYL